MNQAFIGFLQTSVKCRVSYFTLSLRDFWRRGVGHLTSVVRMGPHHWPCWLLGSLYVMVNEGRIRGRREKCWAIGSPSASSRNPGDFSVGSVDEVDRGLQFLATHFHLVQEKENKKKISKLN
ncbi:hypothetical protein CEXT_334811 [Caerostris extrusa]|uniref:Uncharacterized protein n=1 Tax=Caerostris extrusa TaxID=172846 RepID=A0AAV4UZ73_CAEEX|nr:hypothetical protein CEXT_334811 [Caerostris extrusa]